MNAYPPQPWLDTLVADAASERRRLAVLVDPQDAPSGSDWRRLVSHINRQATDILSGEAWSLTAARSAWCTS